MIYTRKFVKFVSFVVKKKMGTPLSPLPNSLITKHYKL